MLKSMYALFTLYQDLHVHSRGDVKQLIAFIAILFTLTACSPRPTPLAAQETVAPAASVTLPAIQTATATPAPAATETPIPTITRTPLPSLTPTITPIGGSGKLLIGYGEVQDNRMIGKGIYLLDLASHQREPALEGDYLLQALADDGDSLLVSSGEQLLRYNLSERGEPTLLTDQFDPRIRHMETLAYWLDANNIVFTSPSMVNLLSLSDGSARPLVDGFFLLPELIPSKNQTGVYWRDDTRPSLRYNRLDGSEMVYNRFAPACISDTGQKIAYNEPAGYKFLVSDISGGNERQIFGSESPVYRLQMLWNEGGGVYSCKWSHNGEQILLSINTKMASPWDGEYRHFILNADGSLAAEIPVELVGNEWLLSAWSPDDQKLLFYYLNHSFTTLDVNSFEMEDLHMQLGISESNAVDRAYWLP